MRGMRERRKEKTGLDMIKPTSFYSSESGKIEKVCISYEPIESYFPNIGDEMINKMTDTISEAWDEMLSFCEVCPNRCISEKDAFCTLFDDNHLFD